MVVACFQQSDTAVITKGTKAGAESKTVGTFLTHAYREGRCVTTVFTNSELFLQSPVDTDNVRAYDAYPYTDLSHIPEPVIASSIAIERFSRGNRPQKQLMYFNGTMTFDE